MSLNTDTHEDSHEQNDNWLWSESFTEFIVEHIDGFSLKICPGLRPIADINLDIKDLSTVAASDDADFTVRDIHDDDTSVEHYRDQLTADSDSDCIYGRILSSPDAPHNWYDGYACEGDMF